MLATAAAQIGVVVENSRVYAQMKARDRLAVLGHEPIRNGLANLHALFSDAPTLAAFAPGAALPIALSQCDGPAVAKPTARGPQIPRAPPTI